MRLKKEEIHKVSNIILQKLKASQSIQARVSDHALLAKIEEVIIADLAAEDRLDEDARKLMENYRSQISSGSMDERKMFQMIKKQLVKERKMVL